MFLRVVTAVVLGLLILGIVFFLPPWGIQALAVLAVALGMLEYTRMFFADVVERWLTVVAGIAVAGVMVFAPGPTGFMPLVLSAVLFLLALVFMNRAAELQGSASRLALAMMGVVYLGVAFPFWSWVALMSAGKGLLLLGLVPACLCDTFALLAGKSFGRHKMAPRVSPGKTIEGLAGALVGSIAGVFLVRWALLPSFPASDALLLCLIVWVTSPFGDLVESYLKRSSGVKDSGTIIPGHGGVLDRLDALIFTGPAVFAYFKYALGM